MTLDGTAMDIAHRLHTFSYGKGFSQSGMSLSQRTLGLFARAPSLLEGVMLTDPLFALHMNPQQLSGTIFIFISMTATKLAVVIEVTGLSCRVRTL